MRCIYCLEERPTRGVAHVFPEALKRNSDVLPLGTVCDPCNGQLGKLDRAVAGHPFLSFAVQMLATKGKRGKARDRVGQADRTIHPGFVTVPCAEPVPSLAPDGSRQFTYRPLPDPNFDLLRFRRGLHHIAFNLVAAMDGPERVCGSEFDRARRYIRHARTGESWPFGQYTVALVPSKPVMFGGIYKSDVDEFVGLRLLGTAFFVDLVSEGRLERFVRTHLPPKTEYVDANYQFSEPAKPSGTKYRVSIEVGRVGATMDSAASRPDT